MWVSYDIDKINTRTVSILKVRTETESGRSTRQEVYHMKGSECSMTATETARLIDWLMSNGHSAEEATKCIKYIAGVPAEATAEK